MPSDKHCHIGSTNRALMPSSSAANVVPKTPLTPRIAASSVVSAPVSPTLRRGTRNDVGGTPGGNLKEDLSTPVKTFLNSNVTPRSSSRKARVDSASSTPNGTPGGTPSGSKPAPSIELLQLGDDFVSGSPRFGLLVSGGKPSSRPASVISEGKQQTISFASDLQIDKGQYGHGYARSDLGDQELSPRFFYASDARTSAVEARHLPSRPINGKMPNFFYANSVNNMSAALSPTNPTSTSLATSSQAKHLRTNGLTEPQVGRRVLHAHSPSSTGTSSISGHVLSTPLQLRPPRLASLNPTLQASEKSRPPSPPKGSTAIAPPREVPTSSHVPITPTFGPSHGQVAPSSREPVPTALFQGCILKNIPRRASHGRSASVGSIDSSPRSQINSSSSVTRLNLATTVADGVPEKSSEKDKIESSSELSGAPPKAVASVPQSPLKNTSNYTSQQIDLAANARRERKVLDLEISNSSLLAINRTLEREMRKQSAELRRYRRLSRSGCLSLTSISEPPPPVSLSDTIDCEDRSDFSEVTEEEESLSDDSFEDGALSPDALVESDARHRAKDERRLQLDLSKHRQLLIDSQKMNQSLKKCLGWTEELIREGRKALEYRVRVSDIRLGGRVLPPDDLEDLKQDTELGVPQDSEGDGEASISITPSEQEKDDLDSGVDLE